MRIARVPAARSTLALVAFALLVGGALVPLAQQGPAPPRWPGLQRDGVTLLPNGWRLAPVGRHAPIGDLPLATALSPDGRYLVVANNGWAEPTLTIFDTERFYIVGRAKVAHTWLGVAWHPDGKRVFASGAASDSVREFGWTPGRLTAGRTFELVTRPADAPAPKLADAGFVGGLAISPDGRRLYTVQVLGQQLVVLDIDTGAVVGQVPLETEPYTCVVSADGRTLFVSMWGGARVLAFDAQTLGRQGEVAVGEHPNAMVLSRDGARLFVACANTNAVWVVDVASRTAKEQIGVALHPDAPVGTTPNALALSRDGKTLLVANADNNNVAIVDVETPGRSEVEGFVPTGWYPTSVTFDRTGSRFFVTSGKGLASAPNPRGPFPGDGNSLGRYTGNMFPGTLTMLDMPTPEALVAMTRRVYELTPYSDAHRLSPAAAPVASPIPARVGDPSPIKYVFYVIRENRTYDQVFGDLPQGNGDPGLVLFGEEITPNAHALAREFVLFDNFYVDAEVSYDGHAFSTGAYATDFVEKIWPTNYGGRGARYLSEGGGSMRTPFGNITAPPQGYLWDFARRAGLTVRSYGEFVTRDDEGGPVRAAVPGLDGLVHPTYPPFDMDIPDARRFEIWLEEFRRFEQDGSLPRLSIINLPRDHTSGTSPGSNTPRAMVADNDLALGRIVETISASRFWPESAIFVLEDDSQNGPDHVDAHRSPALVVSPFARRRVTDSTLYTTSGMLRTMELILGLPPMSQFDAAATPMYAAFQATPDLRPFVHLPPRWPLDEKNDWRSPGAQASLRMNFRDVDAAPEQELNEILWQSVHGAGAVMPPPRRAAFVRPVEADDD
jgi:YVTN family beta-propeller protein